MSRAQNGSTTSASDLAKASQNPISDLVSVPVQFNFSSGSDLGDRSFDNLNLQPVFPLPIGSSWTIIARTIVPYMSTPIPGVRISGIGDIQPLSLGIQYYRNIVRPEGTGSDQIKLVVSFLFPKVPAT